MVSTATMTLNALTMDAGQFKDYRAKRDAEITDKHGKGYAKKYWQAADRLFNASDVVEYRANGVIVKEGDGYTLHAFGDTDSPSAKWRIGAEIDVSDQF